MQALGSGVALESPAGQGHAYGAAVINALDALGCQGTPAPRQWFGGTLTQSRLKWLFLDASGVVVVDAVVYGSRQSSSSANGLASQRSPRSKPSKAKAAASTRSCPPRVAAAAARRRLPRQPTRVSDARPTGCDTDDLLTDFIMQPATTIPAASAAGATNIKVASVADFAAGQTITIDAGANLETAVIAAVGTAGATTAATAIAEGATVIQVAGAAGFVAGQAITIDTGANAGNGGGRVHRRRGRGGGLITVTVTARLAIAHAAGAQVAGTGITLAAPLARAHAAGTPVAGGVPTPGAANQYYRRRH